MEMQQGNQRVKVESNPEDRISALPDCLLIHILSLLPTTKDAARIGVLSKRWLDLLTHLPVLVFFLKRGYDQRHLLDFSNHIDQTLTLNAAPNLQRFRLYGLHVDDLQGIAPRLSSWLRFAILKETQIICLGFEGALDFDPRNARDPSVSYILPEFFYTNPSVCMLMTECCDFAPTGKVEWTSLRFLDIGFSKLSRETLHSILSGSPVLEYLKLSKCIGIDAVEIGSLCSRLNTLVIDDLWLSMEATKYSTFFISGSSIQHLEIYGHGYQMWELDDMPSLVSVKLHFQIASPPKVNVEVEEEDNEDEEDGDYYHGMCRDVVWKLLKKVGHAERLQLGSWCIEVVSSLDVKGFASPLIDCKFLVFKLRDIKQRFFPGMASLLHSSSKLEKLAIQFSLDIKFLACQFEDPDLNRYEFEDNYWIEDNYWRPYKRVCKYLNVIGVFGLREDVYEKGFLFQLIEFLLKNAKKLKTLFVYRDSAWETENVVKMVEELLSFPRSSPFAVVRSRKNYQM